MRDYTSIGPSPCEETCVQVGADDYSRLARIECQRFIDAIRQTLGPEPDGASLRVKSFPHDFGSYMEVVCYYEDENETATDYAFKCESESPSTWPAPENCKPTAASVTSRAVKTRKLSMAGEIWAAELGIPT